jgi:hypothetical protein
MRRHPKKIILQKRVQFRDPTWFERKLYSEDLRDPEYRVHAIGRHIIPNATARRYAYEPLPYALNLIRGTGAEGRKVEAAVAKALLKVQRADPGYVKNRAFAFDVAIDKRGRPRIIEANPEGYSGFLHKLTHTNLIEPQPAFASHHLISALQRRATMPLALGRAVGAGTLGGVGYGAALGGKQLLDSRSNQTTAT